MDEKAGKQTKIYAVILLCVFVIGLSMTVYTYVQPIITATITSVEKVHSRSHTSGKGIHSRETTYYIATVTATWQEGDETREAEVMEVPVADSWHTPGEGTQIEIVRNPFGVYTSYPDTVLRRMGIFIIVFAIVLVLCYHFIIQDYLATRKEINKPRSGTSIESEKVERS